MVVPKEIEREDAGFRGVDTYENKNIIYYCDMYYGDRDLCMAYVGILQ